MKKFLLVVVVLVTVFGLGYVPQYLQVSRLSDELQESMDTYEARLAEMEELNQILQLQRDLGTLLLEVEDRNYGMARERSTEWFDRLADLVSSSATEQTRQALAAISRRRDTLTAMLTEANPDTATHVREMYQALASVTRTE